jgi:hypothetical protein
MKYPSNKRTKQPHIKIMPSNNYPIYLFIVHSTLFLIDHNIASNIGQSLSDAEFEVLTEVGM